MGLNPPDARIGAPKPKQSSIGKPKGRDIFASHWADVNSGDSGLPHVGHPTLPTTQGLDMRSILALAAALSAEGHAPQDPMEALQKASSIGAPKQKDIFASHWQDADTVEPDGDPDDVSYAKSFHQALRGKPDLMSGMGMRPVMGGMMEGNGLPSGPTGGGAGVKALLQALQSQPTVGQGILRNSSPLEEMAAPLEALGEGPSLPSLPTIGGAKLPEKKGKMARFGGALKSAILGR